MNSEEEGKVWIVLSRQACKPFRLAKQSHAGLHTQPQGLDQSHASLHTQPQGLDQIMQSQGTELIQKLHQALLLTTSIPTDIVGNGLQLWFTVDHFSPLGPKHP